MARPHRITPDIAARIDALRGRGLLSKAGLQRALEGEGIRLNWRTLAAYVASAPVPAPVPLPAHMAPPDPPPPPDERSVQRLLEGDEIDVAALARHAVEIKMAIAAWTPRAHSEPVAARTLSTLSRMYAELVAKLVELRPRPEVEAERLNARGIEARQALLARARAAAEPGEVDSLRERVLAQERVIERLTDALADGPRAPQ